MARACSGRPTAGSQAAVGRPARRRSGGRMMPSPARRLPYFSPTTAGERPMAYEGMIAETIRITGHNGDPVSAYVARPLGAGPFPGMVLIHHMPGWDEWYREMHPQLRASRLRGDQPQPLPPLRRGQSRRRRRQGARRRRRLRRPDGRRHRSRGAVPAPPAVAQRQGRPVRHLLGRAADLPVRLPARRASTAAFELWGGRVVWQDELTAKQPVRRSP